jgi:hypothetical protein
LKEPSVTARLITLAVAASLALSALPASAQTLPAACPKAPVIKETEQLVERKLYFHGESAVGDIDGFSGFFAPLLEANNQKMDETAPTSSTPKVDVNASKTVYPATLPGNPIMSAWHMSITDEPLRIACFSFDFWAIGDGVDMNVMMWPDSEFILGTGAREEIIAGGTGENIVHYTARWRPSKPMDAFAELYAQIEANAPASILYDSVEYPSGVTLVLIEPKPVVIP